MDLEMVGSPSQGNSPEDAPLEQEGREAGVINSINNNDPHAILDGLSTCNCASF
jgi:hypothetical protein